jgi:hypothetical protein
MNDVFNHAIASNTGQGGGVDPRNLMETYDPNAKPATTRKDPSDPSKYLPPEMVGDAHLELPRKGAFEHQDPDNKQRPVTPAFYEDMKVKVPDSITVPAYFPEM